MHWSYFLALLTSEDRYLHIFSEPAKVLVITEHKYHFQSWCCSARESYRLSNFLIVLIVKSSYPHHFDLA